VAAPVVRFEAVWKKFQAGERHDSLRDLLPAVARRLVRRPPATELRDKEFWALRDVSFSVDSGEGLAIIGPNGAGKSTTLKLLTRILKPTKGTSQVRGRVGALIEVAAGFHPDLTGRENVFVQGAIMGMKRPEIAARFDQIVEFAGVSQFIDTPVKRYSSGMNARLGFSIAAHLSPDVLIIDEILSVGDMKFQMKCIDRLLAFKKEGTAIVFVTHNLQAAARHFDRGLVLEAGRAVFYGGAAEAVAQYTSGTREGGAASTSGRSWVMRAELVDVRGDTVTHSAPGQRLIFAAQFGLSGDNVDDLLFGFYVHDAATSLRLYSASAKALGLNWHPSSEAGTVTIEFQFVTNLLRGSYHVNCYVANRVSNDVLDRLEPAAHLFVDESFSTYGYVDLDVQCRVKAWTPASYATPLIGTNS
jgi:ABC-type polysaccharide/polyol phosphate transport system ATPase subunit